MALDPIEAEMTSEGAVMRDKFVARGGLQWLMGIPTVLFLLAGLGSLVGGIAAANIAVGLGLGAGALTFAAIFGFMWATLSVLRTALTAHSLNVKCGLWGPEIPLAAIESCRVVNLNGRIAVAGKRREQGMWTTRFVLTSSKPVEVVYVRQDGEKARLQFTASDPDGMVAAIERARMR